MRNNDKKDGAECDADEMREFFIAFVLKLL